MRRTRCNRRTMRPFRGARGKRNMCPLMPAENGFIIAQLRPFSSAQAKNAVLIFSRSGSPKDMFDTPRLVLNPRSRRRRSA